MSPPLVTIVTPSYNQAAYLDEALRSVAEQDYPAIEHVVVDGGSTDGSVEIIESFADRLAWWVSEPDAGQADALNKGFAQANGQILGWLNSDDVLLPGAISAVVEALERDPDALLVFGKNLAVDEHKQPLAEFEGRDLDVVEMVRACWNYAVQPGSLFRRRAWELVGPFEPTAYYYFDLEWVVRLLLAGGKTGRIDRTLALYRIHPTSKTGGAPLPRAYDHLRVFDAIFARPDLPPEVRAVERSSRARSSTTAAEFFLGANERRHARRELVRALSLSPRAVTRWWRWWTRLALQAFLPRPLVDRVDYLKVVR
jgi:glycosyltransferase involved in cell wall biosynthesis